MQAAAGLERHAERRRPQAAVRLAQACSSSSTSPRSIALRYQGARPKLPSMATMPARTRRNAPARHRMSTS